MFSFPADKISSQALASASILKNFSSDADIVVGKPLPSKEISNWYSIFPVENKELVYGKWEDKIIWDDQASFLHVSCSIECKQDRREVSEALGQKRKKKRETGPLFAKRAENWRILVLTPGNFGWSCFMRFPRP